MSKQGGTSAEMTMAGELWNVFDFARRHRLTICQQNRLLMLFGSMARAEDLISNARRNQLIL